MIKHTLILLLNLIASVILAQDCSPDSLVHRSIAAIETDVNIGEENNSHQVFINPDCSSNQKLLIHLVGSFGNPNSISLMPTLAANNGFKVINLRYRNETPAVSSCQNSNDSNCYANYREEIVFGVNSSDAVDVDQTNSIINRIEKLLVFLDNNYPNENWAKHIAVDGTINWPSIILSGHSQGGGHAAYIAKQFQVDRVMMFASPNDYSNFFSEPAGWLSSNSATPDSAFYAFGNVNDEVVDFSKQFENWSALNLTIASDSMNVDVLSCGDSSARVLYTDYEADAGISTNHNSVIVDAFTPLNGGVPMFQPVWEYMLGFCGTSTPVFETQYLSKKIRLFPNPSSDHAYVESEEEIKVVKTFAASGALLHEFTVEANNFRLDLDYNNGIYFLQFITTKGLSGFKKLLLSKRD